MADAPSAHERIASEARTQLSAAGLAPDDAAVVEVVVRRLVGEYQARAHQGQDIPLRRPEEKIREIVGEIVGHGALEALLAEDGLEDVLIEGASVTALGGGKLRGRSSLAGTTGATNRHTIDRLLAPTGRALNATTPVVDGVQVCLIQGQSHERGDHSGCRRGRLAAMIPPVSPHLSADIRVFGARHGDLGEMVDDGVLSAAAANFLTLIMRAKGSVLIGGQTGSRKSTLLVALLRRARPGHILRLVEESYELALDIQAGGRYQISGGEGSRSLSELIRTMLRMRADLIVVGEVRGKECWDLAQAASSGAGWLATIHSRSAEGSLDRLILLSLLAGENVSARLVRDTFADSLDVVVHCERTDGEGDYVAGVTQISTLEPSLSEDGFSSLPLFARRDSLADPLEWNKAEPTGRLAERLERLLPADWDLHDLLTSKELLV